MKNLVIIVGTIVLGCLIFDLIVGDNEGSLKNESKEVMINCIEDYLE
ncbi:MAG: hypothetical protein JJE03_01830 [Peptostreptococcaceae bacterium]|nr:hypothetical protein [Peptostreptococcaceae bacterium]